MLNNLHQFCNINSQSIQINLLNPVTQALAKEVSNGMLLAAKKKVQVFHVLEIKPESKIFDCLCLTGFTLPESNWNYFVLISLNLK